MLTLKADNTEFLIVLNQVVLQDVKDSFKEGCRHLLNFICHTLKHYMMLMPCLQDQNTSSMNLTTKIIFSKIVKINSFK